VRFGLDFTIHHDLPASPDRIKYFRFAHQADIFVLVHIRVFLLEGFEAEHSKPYSKRRHPFILRDASATAIKPLHSPPPAAKTPLHKCGRALPEFSLTVHVTKSANHILI